MASTSQLGAVLLALRDQLLDRGGLEGVTVLRFGTKPDDMGRQFIVLCVALTAETERPSLSYRNRLERATMTGVVSARSSGDSTDGDDEAQAAMDRALEIYAELENQVAADPTVNGTTTELLMESAEHNYYTDGLSRIYDIKFTMSLMTQLM